MERLRVEVEWPRCPYCHDAIVRGEEPVVCPACHAMHHEACLSDHGACAACAAPHPRFAARPEPSPRAALAAKDPEDAMRVEPSRHATADAKARARSRLGLLGTLRLLLAFVLIGAVIGYVASPGANDAAVAIVLALSATAALGVGRRGAWALAAAFTGTFALGLLALLELSPHIAQRHAEDALTGGLTTIVLAICFLGVHLVARRTPREATPGDGERS